jgi:hypothetical protein
MILQSELLSIMRRERLTMSCCCEVKRALGRVSDLGKTNLECGDLS